MKKQLLLLIIPILLAGGSTKAQIKYWDFGAQELGAGYENVLPLEYLNAWANYNRQVEYVDENNVTHSPNAGYENENGKSREAIYNATFNPNYASGNFQVSSKGSSPTPPGGTLLSGGSEYTKPKNLPDLDGNADLVYQRDSNSDRILTTRKDVTRYDDRTTMPDNMDSSLFPGCLQFTTAGEKRYDRNGGRGFLINLEAGQWITVVGSGEYTDIEGDGTGAFSTGYFKFENFGGTGTPLEIDDKGAGTGSPSGPLSGSDTGDEAVRVMQFQASDAGTYRLANRGGKIRVYRIYLGQVDASLGMDTKIYINGVYSKTLGIDKNTQTSTNIHAAGNRIYISNVKTKTEVNIYSVTGALVQTIKTNEDTNFEFKSGLWIATVNSADGQKSVKLITR